MPEKRLFFALWPSNRQREQIRGSVNPLLAGVEGTRVDRRDWHVTLVYIGDFPEDRIRALQDAAGQLVPGEIRLRFECLTFWQKPRIACLLSKTVPRELQALVLGLQKALIPFGYAPDTRVYRPHITVARNARAFTEVRMARPIDVSWSDFELIESVPVRGGLRYSPLKQ